MKRISLYIKLIFSISILKTLYFNFKAFKLSKAIHLPVIIGRNTVIRNVGTISIGDYDFSKKIHIGSVNLFNTTTHSHTIWNNLGKVIFNGPVIFYPSTTIYVATHGTLEFGGNNRFGKNTSLLCAKNIRIGHTSGFSWDCQIADTDFHFIEDINTHKIKPRSLPISIGNNVWCGNRVVIGKGVRIADNCICGMNTLVTKSCDMSGALLLGIPAKIHGENLRRIFDVNEENSLIQKFG